MTTSHFHVYGKMIAYDLPVVKQCRNIGGFVITDEIYILKDAVIDGVSYHKEDKFPRTADSFFVENI